MSHRWFDTYHPDKESAKPKRLKDLLEDRPDISSVWIDHTCLPQGRRNEQEQRYFDWALQNVNLLYMTCEVVIFLDQMYTGRFWTQYETFGATHTPRTSGLVPKSFFVVFFSNYIFVTFPFFLPFFRFAWLVLW